VVPAINIIYSDHMIVLYNPRTLNWLIILSLYSNKEVFPNLLFNLQIAVLIFDITIKPVPPSYICMGKNQEVQQGFQGGNTVKT